MVEVDYLHLCDYAFLAESAKPCIIGIFDRIFTESFPITHQRMTIAVGFQGQAHEVTDVAIEVSRPNGDVLNTMTGTVPFSEDGRAFLSLQVVNLTLPDSGRYTIKISAGGRVLATRSFRAMRRPTEALGGLGARVVS